VCGPVHRAADGAGPAKKYFAHPAVEDRNGVIAPWYGGQNGQCDFRVRIAAETLKRYPWADKSLAVMPAPHFVFNGHWGIKPDGTILVNPKLSDWDNGDVGQRSVSLLFGLAEYYRYSGDPAAVGLVTLTADYLLDYCQTSADHRWPGFPVSAPTKGKAYGRADPHGFIQLDLSAQLGSAVLAAYKLTGNPRYLDAVKRWADLLAGHCDYGPGRPPWNRYANPEDVKWDTRQTAGIALVLQFLDDCVRGGYQGKDGALIRAREAGEKYLRDVMMPQWSRDRTFGHNFWDWENATDTCAVSSYAADYMMGRRESFPDWKIDARNILTLFLCRSSVDPASAGGVYSGAWAVPEANNCCGKSLQYPTMGLAATLARYALLADSAWAREVARRQALLATYDAHETGVVEDGVDGGPVVAGDWFNLAHPWPLRATLRLLAWQPEALGADRENHIMRSTTVVSAVHYDKGRIAYSTAGAAAPSEDVLRLAFQPRSVSAGGKPLPRRQEPLQQLPSPSGRGAGAEGWTNQNGFTVKPLPNGDCLVTIRHYGQSDVVVEGDDPQELAPADRLHYAGTWSTEDGAGTSGGELHVASQAGARVSGDFEGNQVRLIGRADPSGGKADVYLDGVKQLCGVDFWCPQSRAQQVLVYNSGLAQGRHRLEIVALGTKNPWSSGTRVYIGGVQSSAAEGRSGFGAGGGPADTQRVVFGYVGRKDYVDSTGGTWRPATEFILRLKPSADLVPLSFWTEPRVQQAALTPDPELYRYGIHGRDFTAYFTVLPAQPYHVRLKFCQTEQPAKPGGYATNVDICGRQVVRDMDIAATAGGLGRAVDLVFNDIRPAGGVVSVRLWNGHAGEAMIQAIEVGPGPSPPGAKAVQSTSAR
jgi:hypothetical protein